MILPGLLFAALLLTGGCTAQDSKKKIMTTTDSGNPLHCNPDSGMCEIPAARSRTAELAGNAGTAAEKPIRILYFTDPICSSCWGIEPQLRRLKAEYGDCFEIEYHMGGLLPDWSYNAGGISKPSDVAGHWEEASQYYRMPIDGSIWLEDPLSSSYPPSIAFKAAQMQDSERALTFLRRIREMVFMEKKNITREEHLRQAALDCGLNAEELLKDMKGPALKTFQADLELTRSYGVRGFPSLIFSDGKGNKRQVYGSKPYAQFEQSLKDLWPEAPKKTFDAHPEALFAKFSTLTSLEFATLSGSSMAEAEQVLGALFESGKLEKISIRNGNLWKGKGSHSSGKPR